MNMPALLASESRCGTYGHEYFLVDERVYTADLRSRHRSLLRPYPSHGLLPVRGHRESRETGPAFHRRPVLKPGADRGRGSDTKYWPPQPARLRPDPDLSIGLQAPTRSVSI